MLLRVLARSSDYVCQVKVECSAALYGRQASNHLPHALALSSLCPRSMPPVSTLKSGCVSPALQCGEAGCLLPCRKVARASAHPFAPPYPRDLADRLV